MDGTMRKGIGEGREGGEVVRGEGKVKRQKEKKRRGRKRQEETRETYQSKLRTLSKSSSNSRQL